MDVDRELINKMQRFNPQKGIIVRVEGKFRVLTPQSEEEEERSRGRGQSGDNSNGLEETLCSMKLRQNIKSGSQADVFNRRAGRLNSVNGYTLPIRNRYQLSMEHTHLYPVSKISIDSNQNRD